MSPLRRLPTARLLSVVMVVLVAAVLVAGVRAERPAASPAAAGPVRQEIHVDLSDPSRTIEVTLPERADARLALANPEEERALRPGTLPAGYTLGDGRRVDLHLVKSEIVVKFATPQDVALARAAGAEVGLTRAADLDGALASYEVAPEGEDAVRRSRTLDLGGLLAAMNARPDVEYALPAYYDLRTATRLWPTDRIVVGVADASAVGAVLAAFPELDAAGHVFADEAVRIFRLRDARGADPLHLADRVRTELAAAGVLWAEPDFHVDYQRSFTPNDTLLSECWHLHNTGQAIPGALGVDAPTNNVDVNAPAAWDVARGAGIVVAIIDDGVQTAHPDLNLFVNTAEQNGSAGVDDDGNGLVDDINGWDFRNNDNNPNPDTYDAHGTACAGVAVGKGNNSLGTLGAAFDAKVLPVKIASATASSGGFASNTAIANAINYAWTKADVLSNSWGGGSPSTAVQAAIKNSNQKGRNGLGSPILFANGNSAAGFIKARLSGLSAGTWTLEWRYTKNASTVGGEDSVWLDDISLPGVGVIDFENVTPPALPAGFTTSGNANWTTVSGGTKRRSGTRAAKAGAIGHSQSTSLSYTGTLAAGDVSYHIWYSTQLNSDVTDLRLVSGSNTYGPYIALSGESNQYGDPAYRVNDESSPSSWPEAISVAAIAADGYRSYYSQYGALTDFGAPSNGHSANAGIATIDRTSTNGYNTASGTAGDYCRAGEESGFGGTSSATPLAAGVAALTLSANPSLSSSQVRDVLRRTARKIGPVAYAGGAGTWLGGRNNEYGYGMVDAAAAATFATTGSPATGQMGADLLVSEVLPAPSGSVEFLEFYNKSTTTTYTLTGFGITDNEMFDDTSEGCLQFPDGTTIPPQGMILVVTGGAATSGFVSTVTTNAAGAGAPAGGVKMFEATNSGLSFGGTAIADMTSVGGTLSLADTADNIALVFVGGDEVSYRGDVVSGLRWGSETVTTGNEVAIAPGRLDAASATAPAAGSSLRRAGLGINYSSAADFAAGASDPGAWTALGGGTTPPPAPTGLTYPASDADGSYTVSWNAASGATGYTLERSSNGGSSWTQVQTGSATSRAETVGNGSYRYRVLASNAGGSSAWTTGSTDCVVNIPVGGSNDSFASPTVVTGATGTTTSTNTSATKETGEPNHGGNAGGKSIWFSWTPASSGSVTITTAGSNFDTTLGVYTGSAVNALTTVASNDDVQSGTTTSSVTFSATGGTTYRVAVDGYNAASGNVTLNWNQTTATPPAAPTGLSYPSSSSTGSYSVTWTASSGATSYTVQRSSNGGSTWSTVSSPTTTSYAESVSVSGSYRYRVAANNAAGASAYATGSTDCVVTISTGGSNNAFASATTISGAKGTVTGSNVGATKETGEPSHAGNAGGASVWWAWTAPASGTVTIDTVGSSFDTTLGVYTGTAVNALTAVASNDDLGSGSTQSRVSFAAVSGVTYRIAVDGYKGSGAAATGSITLNWDLPTTAAPATPSSLSHPATSSTGQYSVTWTASSGATSYQLERSANAGSTWAQVYNGASTSYSESVGAGSFRYRVRATNAGGSSAWRTSTSDTVVSVSQPAPHNTFASAPSLTGTSGTATGSNTSATKEVGEPNHGGNSGGKSVWWKWTAPSNGTLSVNTFGSNFDTLLSVYTGTAVNALTSRASNDDANGGTQSSVSLSVTAGTVYRIAVDGYAGRSGSITLGWTFSSGARTARITLDHGWPGDLEMVVAVGPVEAPYWFRVVEAPVPSSGVLELVVDLAGAEDFLPPSAANPWHLYVKDPVLGERGAVRDFVVRVDGASFGVAPAKLPADVPDAGEVIILAVEGTSTPDPDEARDPILDDAEAAAGR